MTTDEEIDSACAHCRHVDEETGCCFCGLSGSVIQKLQEERG